MRETASIIMTLSMAKYIENACNILNVKGESWVPINKPIDAVCHVLSAKGKTGFLTVVGMHRPTQCLPFGVSHGGCTHWF